MKTSTGLKWGLVFGLLFGVLSTVVYYSLFVYPQLPQLEHYYYQEILNSTHDNITAATQFTQELPVYLPFTLLYLDLIGLVAGGLLGGFLIAKLWDKSPNWYMKGLMGGIASLLLDVLLLGFLLASLGGTIVYTLSCVLMGLAVAYKLNKLNKSDQDKLGEPEQGQKN
ncbi:hypothetical protein [Stygiolobus caldivivus]|uniref:Uncharacterized protein n=1 Tax=Stygiolobus caldivivus TaxID=2824673 RepID=A0A8D5U7X7_9CREN|nr:hypothetical protein [Stygiolobus caldivivus]BCU70842.1 hypothetical protein KN1_21390 [Stygiolobus caldivivus]